MIEVDLNVPCLNKNYNFVLNEEATVKIIIDEITEMISQKEQSKISSPIVEFYLLCVETKKILAMHQSIDQSGIKTGNHLILI